MADETPQEERTEQASQQQRTRFRERGEVARSREVPSALLFLVSAGLISLGASDASDRLANIMRTGFGYVADAEAVPLGGLGALLHLLAMAAPLLASILLAIMLVGVGSTLMQTGFLWSTEGLAPNLGKVFSLKKLKKMFLSMDMVVELVKTLLKVGVLGFVGWKVLASFLPQIVTLPLYDVSLAPALLGKVILSLLAAVGVGTSFIAAFDYAWQRRSLSQRMKMTKEDVKRENKDSQGDPLIRGLRKRMHREMSMNRMLTEVPTANVVVTNPTHFAVALRYAPGQTRAPIVVAKGVDGMALRIRREAVHHGVPIVEQRPLARALHRHVKLGREIPERLYGAVAEVLAYVHTIDEAHRSRRPVARDGA